MSEGRVVFILNPKSANGVTRKRFERARGYAQRVIGDIDVRFTERPMHAAELAREAVRAKERAVIAVGGDGTINEVLNGFFDEGHERIDSPTALGVLTSGTGGDFRRTLGFPVDPRKDLDRIGAFHTRRVDVGRCDYTAPSGETGTRMFMNIGSMGVSGEIVNAVNHSSKALGARLSFLRGTLSTLVSAPPNHVRLTLDGAPDEPRKVTFIAVSNGQYFGGSMHVAPNAEIDDGKFDVVVAEGEGFGFWVKHAVSIYRGTHINLPNVQVHRCAEVRAEPTGGREVLIELDGEQPGRLPATFRLLPACVDLICDQG